MCPVFSSIFLFLPSWSGFSRFHNENLPTVEIPVVHEIFNNWSWRSTPENSEIFTWQTFEHPLHQRGAMLPAMLQVMQQTNVCKTECAQTRDPLTSLSPSILFVYWFICWKQQQEPGYVIIPPCCFTHCNYTPRTVCVSVCVCSRCPIHTFCRLVCVSQRCTPILARARGRRRGW